jgi:hypothetical protein
MPTWVWTQSSRISLRDTVRLPSSHLGTELTREESAANDDQMPMQEDAPDYSFLLDSQDQSPAAGIFDLVSPMDSGLNSKAGSVGTPSTVSTPVAGEVESGKGKSTKRKSDVHSPEVRKSARRA